MREIKFRGWKGCKRVDNFCVGTNLFGVSATVCDVYDKWSHIELDCIEQFTGLLDSNGVEIYEGDVVRWDDATNGKVWRVAEVVWQDKGQWGYRIIQDQCVNCFKDNKCSKVFGMGSFIYTPDPSAYGNVLEVIGNIHQNMELLK
jgi:uncharacterized phage protein (TIGR01671 family)